MLIEFILLVLTIAALLVLYFRKNYGTLEKLGIPVVKTHFLFGSQSDFHKIVGHERDYEWFLKHGEVYGVYKGRHPEMHIVDPDIVRQIFIKDFDKFTNRSLDIGESSTPVFKEMMDFLKDDKWKTVRTALTPIYTASKLKRMSQQMIEAMDDMMVLLQQDLAASPNGKLENFDIYREVFSTAMDMTARCTLNIKIENPRDPDNDFAKALRELFPESPTWMLVVFNLFPEIVPLLAKLSPQKDQYKYLFFVKVFQQVMAERRKSKEVYEDLIDLVNAMVDKTKNDEEYKRLGITETTVLAQGIEFFIAGIDGMATAIMALAMYASQNPEISKKLYEEVDAYLLRNKGVVSHETLSELKYLNACIYEALRLHPPFTRPDRICKQDVVYKGIKIPKGMSVAVPLWPYNRNPRFFKDPHSFDPERFMPHNKDNIDMFTFGSFGHGPRMCIGMRFALECMLIIGVKLYQNFEFTAKPDDKVNYYPSVLPGFSLAMPTLLTAKKRTEE